MSVKKWVMSDEWWVMSDEWWVMSDGNWVTKKKISKQPLSLSSPLSFIPSLSLSLLFYSLIYSKPPRPNPPSPSQVGATHHSLTQVLKNFNKIHFLPIELPSVESGIKDGILLNWHADFGSTLNDCLILDSRMVLHSPTSAADFGYLLCL